MTAIGNETILLAVQTCKSTGLMELLRKRQEGDGLLIMTNIALVFLVAGGSTRERFSLDAILKVRHLSKPGMIRLDIDFKGDVSKSFIFAKQDKALVLQELVPILTDVSVGRLSVPLGIPDDLANIQAQLNIPPWQLDGMLLVPPPQPEGSTSLVGEPLTLEPPPPLEVPTLPVGKPLTLKQLLPEEPTPRVEESFTPRVYQNHDPPAIDRDTTTVSTHQDDPVIQNNADPQDHNAWRIEPLLQDQDHAHTHHMPADHPGADHAATQGSDEEPLPAFRHQDILHKNFDQVTEQWILTPKEWHNTNAEQSADEQRLTTAVSSIPAFQTTDPATDLDWDAELPSATPSGLYAFGTTTDDQPVANPATMPSAEQQKDRQFSLTPSLISLDTISDDELFGFSVVSPLKETVRLP